MLSFSRGGAALTGMRVRGDGCGPRAGGFPSLLTLPLSSQTACLTWSSLQAEGKEPCPQVIGITLGLSVAVCKMVD